MDYCEKCNRCHDDGLRDDEECCFYGEPYGCNHPNLGYSDDQKKYEELMSENDRLRKALNDIIDYIEGHSTGDDDLHYFVAPIAEEALLVKGE